MGSSGNCCCTCLPLSAVPKLTIPGYEPATAEWQQEGTCCYKKTFTAIETPEFVDGGSQVVEHTTIDGHIEWEVVGLEQYLPWIPGSGCSGDFDQVVIGTFLKELKQEWKVRMKSLVKLSDTIEATWSKVCDAECGYMPGDRWILQLNFSADYEVREETQYWIADRYTKSVPGNPPCYPMYYPPFTENRWDPTLPDGWWGGTNIFLGGTRQEGGAGLPPKVDDWVDNGLFISGEVDVVRYKVFTSIPETETVFEIDESDVLQECEVNACVVDPVMDGDSIAIDQDPLLCGWTYSVVTGPTKTCLSVPSFSFTQDYVQINEMPAPLSTANFLIGAYMASFVPFGFSFTGSRGECIGHRVSDFSPGIDCLISGDQTYVVAPAIEVRVEQA